MTQEISRRKFLVMFGGGIGTALLPACQTTKEVKVTRVVEKVVAATPPAIMERSPVRTQASPGSPEEILAELKKSIQKDLKMLGGGAIFEQYLRGELQEEELEHMVRKAIGGCCNTHLHFKP